MPTVVRVMTTKYMASSAVQSSMCMKMTAGMVTKTMQPARMKRMVEMTLILV